MYALFPSNSYTPIFRAHQKMVDSKCGQGEGIFIANKASLTSILINVHFNLILPTRQKGIPLYISKTLSDLLPFSVRREALREALQGSTRCVWRSALGWDH